MDCTVVRYRVGLVWFTLLLLLLQLPPIIEANFPVECGSRSIMGHRSVSLLFWSLVCLYYLAGFNGQQCVSV